MTDKEKLKEIKKLADSMYYAAMYLTTDASRLHKAMDEYHKFIVHECKEEPVSDELEKVVEEIVDPTVLNAYGVKEIANRLRRTMIDSVSDDLGEYINKLSKQFPEVSFAKLSRIAVRVAKWQKEKMMERAIDVEVKVDAGGYPYIPQLELYDYDNDIPLAKEGDKYKVVLIKEG